MKTRAFLALLLLLIASISLPTGLAQQTDSKRKDALAKQEEQKRRYQEEIARAREKVKPLLLYDIETFELALRIRIIDKFAGAIVVVKDPIAGEAKYLGTIENEFASESIFNDFGAYGSKFSSDSIWNSFGSYGSEFSSESPFNKFSSSPPAIIKNKKIIGYLTVNKLISGAVHPDWLKTYFKQ